MSGKAEIHPQAFSDFGEHAVNSCDRLRVDMVTTCEYERGTQEWSVWRYTFIFLKRKPAFLPYLSLGWQWEKGT